MWTPTLAASGAMKLLRCPPKGERSRLGTARRRSLWEAIDETHVDVRRICVRSDRRRKWTASADPLERRRSRDASVGTDDREDRGEREGKVPRTYQHPVLSEWTAR